MIKSLATNHQFIGAEDLRNWLAAQANEYRLKYLLAYSEDGVIWGSYKDGKLTLAAEVFPDIAEVQVYLNPDTLRQAHLFSRAGELLLWRAEAGFNARLLDEQAVAADDILDETYRLWGKGMKTDGPAAVAGFTLMHDGRQGLRHAPPLPDAIDQQGALAVKHHLEYDSAGQARIARSRLVDLQIVKEEENGAEA